MPVKILSTIVKPRTAVAPKGSDFDSSVLEQRVGRQERESIAISQKLDTKIADDNKLHAEYDDNFQAIKVNIETTESDFQSLENVGLLIRGNA